MGAQNIGVLSVAVHGDLIFTNQFIMDAGLKLSDFVHETKSLGRPDTTNAEGDVDEDADPIQEKPLKRVFTSVGVDTILDEIRQAKARRAGFGQVRRNRGDTGEQLFGEDGLKNVIVPHLVSAALKGGLPLIELLRVRKPRRYTQGDVKRSSKWLQGKVAIPEERCVKPVPTGENGELTDKDRDLAAKVQEAYLNSIQEGKIDKTYPTIARPLGSTQVWKYEVRMNFLRTNEPGAPEIAQALEQNVFAKEVWENCHIWVNPDGSVTVNLTPHREGTPKVKTTLTFDPETEHFGTEVEANRDHPEFDAVKFGALRDQEERRINAAREAGADQSVERQRNREVRQASRELGGSLRAKLAPRLDPATAATPSAPRFGDLKPTGPSFGALLQKKLEKP